jgi:hypothetical protein
LGLELAYLEQVEAEGLDLSQDAVQRGLVQEPGEHGVRPVPPRRHRREPGQHGGAEVPVDPDHVPGGCRVHDAMVKGWQVKPHHQDPVTAGLERAAGRQHQAAVTSRAAAPSTMSGHVA